MFKTIKKVLRIAVAGFIGVFVLIAILANIFGESTSERAEREAKAEQVRFAEIRKKAVAKQQKLLTANRPIITSKIEALIKSKKYSDALAEARRYQLAGDKQINSFIKTAKTEVDKINEAKRIAANRAEERTLLTVLKGMPASNHDSNIEAYTQLSILIPNNQTYKNKLAHYKKLKADKAKKEDQERERWIARVGNSPVPSPWDGSYHVVESYLENIAHDPDSLEIDNCTKVYKTDNSWLVGCEYRAKNGFGAMRRHSNWFSIIHNRVIEMHKPDAFKI